MIQVKFWVNDLESKVYEYEKYIDKNDEDFINEMEQDRIEWIFSQINTGYKILNIEK